MTTPPNPIERTPVEQIEAAYDRIDRHLRNSLDDADYKEFSEALETLDGERRTLLAENVRLREALESAAWFLADISPDGLVRKKVNAALSTSTIARATGATP